MNESKLRSGAPKGIRKQWTALGIMEGSRPIFSAAIGGIFLGSLPEPARPQPGTP